MEEFTSWNNLDFLFTFALCQSSLVKKKCDYLFIIYKWNIVESGIFRIIDYFLSTGSIAFKVFHPVLYEKAVDMIKMMNSLGGEES